MFSPTPSAAMEPEARPPLAVPPRPAQGRGLWALPLLLSLLFLIGVIVWAQRNDRDDREELRHTMISDALSLEAQLRARLDNEVVHLRVLAGQLQSGNGKADDTAALAANPEVAAGLRRLWLSVTWLDAQNRIKAHVPQIEPAPGPTLTANLNLGHSGLDEDNGLSAHLVAPMTGPGTPGDGGAARRAEAGSLVVRYSPAVLLKRGVPWWLARKYDVALVDSFDQVLASTSDAPAQGPAQAAGDSYKISFGAPSPDMYLQLTQREALQPWYRTLPMVLMAGFLALIVAATALLRRQVRRVSHAELAWRTEAAWRSAMEDSALVALRARDAEGRLLYVNRTFCEMVGLPADQLLGLAPPMPYWPPDAIDEVMLRNRRNLAGEAPREGYEARWVHRDGHVLDVMVFESPLVDAQGRQIGWMGSIVDITQRKRLEERERRQNETLAHHARLTMLGEVASTLAHELNQPLSAIASYNAGIINSVNKHAQPDPVVLGALERLGQQAAHAGRIVQRIREFLTRREPQQEACDLNRLVSDAVALLQRELQRQGVQLELRLEPDLPAVVADAVLIEQVVINLVRNANDAMSGQQTARHITVGTARAAGRFVRIDVSDTGPGLNGRSIEALCAPFYSTKRDGMGMGLAICRSIIEVHHGAFDAADAGSGGAHFFFSLPLDTEPVQEHMA
nr:PAS domain S-box protein [uncultured Roseateles sp.]